MPRETAEVQTSRNYQSMAFLNKPNYIHSPDNKKNFLWKTEKHKLRCKSCDLTSLRFLERSQVCSQRQQRCKKNVLSRVMQRFPIKLFSSHRKTKQAWSHASQDYVCFPKTCQTTLAEKYLATNYESNRGSYKFYHNGLFSAVDLKYTKAGVCPR